MNELSDLKLDAWLDEAQVLVVQPSPSPLKAFIKKAVTAALVGAALASAGFGATNSARETRRALREPVAWYVQQSGASSQPSAAQTSTAHKSTFSDHAKIAGWQSALELLRASGVDITAIIAAGAQNVARYGFGDHVFPAALPKDE
jgi:hypothetical protein